MGQEYTYIGPLFAERAPAQPPAPVPEPKVELTSHQRHAKLITLARQAEKFKKSHGPDHKNELIAMVKELSDLKPIELGNDGGDYRATIEGLEVEQERLKDVGDAQWIRERMRLRDIVGGLAKEMKDASKQSAQMATPELFADTYVKEGADHPNLKHFAGLGDYAGMAQQYKAWKPLAQSLYALWKAAKTSEVRDGTLRALQAFDASGETEIHDSRDNDKLYDLACDPNEKTLLSALTMVTGKITEFDKHYKETLLKRYREGVKSRNQDELPDTDPRVGECKTLDIVYLSRWSEAADLISQRLYSNSVSVADPRVGTSRQAR